MTERAYCRVYYTIKDDPKFEGIREDDHHLAAWLRLLMAADAIWPASPDLPASARKASVKALVDAGIVDILPGGRYRIHGLDAERGTRRDNARTSVAHRTYNERNTNVSESGYSHSEPSQAEPSQAETESEPTGAQGDDLWALYRSLTKATSLKPAAIDWLERLEGTYGVKSTATALLEEHAKDSNPGTLLGRVSSRLEGTARRAEKDGETEKRSANIQAKVLERRLDEYRFTKTWRPEWGEVPEGILV